MMFVVIVKTYKIIFGPILTPFTVRLILMMMLGIVRTISIKVYRYFERI
jgi:hypothetical protein